MEGTPIKTSVLGTPVYSDLKFLYVPGTSLDDSGAVGPVMMALDSVMITVNRPKKMVIDEIPGSGSSVKTLIGASDYMVTIHGMIVGSDQFDQPTEQTELLNEILSLADILPVESKFLDIFGIRNIAIDSFSIGQVYGTQNAFNLEINAFSDDQKEKDFIPL